MFSFIDGLFIADDAEVASVGCCPFDTNEFA
jgi:hypothetical protein